jgi:hypothetical protein
MPLYVKFWFALARDSKVAKRFDAEEPKKLLQLSKYHFILVATN